MTTIQEAQAIIDTMPAAMSAKGKKNPDAHFTINSNANPQLFMTWEDPNEVVYNTVHHFFKGDSFDDLAEKAQAWLAELPSAEEAKLNDFMKGLGKLIDNGKDAGISLEFMNPLLESMKRLSENVITYQPAGE